MDERVLQLRVGVVVLAATTITVILIVFFGALPSITDSYYTLHILFPEAPGVAENTPVRKSGVQIGRVFDVKLLDDADSRGVVISMRINREYTLRRDEVCRIGTGSLVTGDASLEWVRWENATSDAPLGDGDFMTNGQLERDPFQVLVSLEGRMTSAFTKIENAAVTIEQAGGEVAQLVRGLSTSVGNNEAQLKRIMQKTETSLDAFSKTMTSVESVIGDEEVQRSMRRVFHEMPMLLDQSKKTLAEIEMAATSFRAATDTANDNLENLKAVTDPLAERGERLVANLDSTISNLDAVLAELLEFGESLNDSQGTIGQLVHNPELYNRVNRAVGNFERVSRRLEPIVNDVRIFSDKIARDPRQLGVKGALDRRPSGAGLKFPRPGRSLQNGDQSKLRFPRWNAEEARR